MALQPFLQSFKLLWIAIGILFVLLFAQAAVLLGGITDSHKPSVTVDEGGNGGKDEALTGLSDPGFFDDLALLYDSLDARLTKLEHSITSFASDGTASDGSLKLLRLQVAELRSQIRDVTDGRSVASVDPDALADTIEHVLDEKRGGQPKRRPAQKKRRPAQKTKATAKRQARQLDQMAQRGLISAGDADNLKAALAHEADTIAQIRRDFRDKRISKEEMKRLQSTVREETQSVAKGIFTDKKSWRAYKKRIRRGR